MDDWLDCLSDDRLDGDWLDDTPSCCELVPDDGVDWLLAGGVDWLPANHAN